MIEYDTDDSDNDFEEQIRLQEQEEKEKDDTFKNLDLTTRKDADGTVYEWDREKKAWFPKIDKDFIAQYQMSYGEYKAPEEESKPSSIPPAPSDINSEEYREWYYKYYSPGTSGETQSTKGGTSTNSDTASTQQSYDEYYKKYAEWYAQSVAAHKDDKEGDSESSKTEEENEQSKRTKDYYEYYKEYYNQHHDGEKKDPKDMTDEEKLEYEEAWHKYYDYYYGSSQGSNQETDKDKKSADADSKADSSEVDKDGKKAKKRKGIENKKPPEWFDATEDKNTNVYVTGLPESMTIEEFEVMMKKYGLIMFDPFTRKPKLKLYKNKDGKNKGDGLCCYIKQESVQLCLDLLNESDLHGYKIYVERAKFERKGEFDPNLAKKKKLSNKQKRKMKEKQEKLFAWKPDIEDSGRQKHEKIIVVKNVFDPKMFETNPALINDVRDNLRNECSNHGEVKKVNVYDRHHEGICTVAFTSPEEADMCIQAINGRFFRSRVIQASTWDGKTKFDVEETEEERNKRLRQWEEFLESDEASAKAKDSKSNIGIPERNVEENTCTESSKAMDTDVPANTDEKSISDEQNTRDSVKEDSAIDGGNKVDENTGKMVGSPLKPLEDAKTDTEINTMDTDQASDDSKDYSENAKVQK